MLILASLILEQKQHELSSCHGLAHAEGFRDLGMLREVRHILYSQRVLNPEVEIDV